MPHFTFHGTSGNPSAFAFIDVKPKGSQPYKIIAYLPQYDPKNLSVTPFPYREKFSGPENLKTFRGELKDITFGAAPWKLPDSNEAVASNLQRPLRLRFVTPDNSTEKDTGTLVGLAEVSDGTPQTDSNRGQGHVLLNVYRMKDVKIFSSAGIEYANLVYVLTSGQKPDLTPPVKKPDDKSS